MALGVSSLAISLRVSSRYTRVSERLWHPRLPRGPLEALWSLANLPRRGAGQEVQACASNALASASAPTVSHSSNQRATEQVAFNSIIIL